MQTIPITFFTIPIYLSANTANDLDLFGPQGKSAEELSEIIHKIIRVVRIDKTDSDQDFA